MMTKNINLLPKKKVIADAHDGALLFCRRLATGALIITAGTSIIFFILTINPSFSAIKQQENAVLAKLSFTQGKVAKYILLKNRLVVVDTLLKKRFPMDSVLSEIVQDIPDTVTIDAINITDKTAAFRLSSPSLLPLQTVLASTAKQLANKELFKKITVQSIIVDPVKQVYVVSIQADLL